ncbi:MAG: helix-turn-helix transcriptional regulator [Bacteroidales bacterium]|jgi:transcriptional regulator with XRE-family HTH domain|nr:helix-turn-helix transcriptional regulator [Bacteroidales bacterium]
MENYISLNIAYLVRKKNLGNDEFGRLFDLNRGSIASYIDAKAQPKIATLQKISEYFDISIDDLINKDISKVMQNANNNIGNGQQIIANHVQGSINADNRQYYSDSPDVLRAQIDERDRLIVEKEKILNEKDERIREKDERIRELLSEKEELKEELKEYKGKK